MGQQIHKRVPKEFVEEVLEAFNEGRITEEKAKGLLGVRRARFYKIRKAWLIAKIKGKEFKLWNRKRSDFNVFSDEITNYLHKELKYIRTEADVYRGRFNFAFLSELAEKEFDRTFHRNSVRLFAIRHGYYHALPEEKSKADTRFETSGPGALYQHDTSHHIWLPLTGARHPLILTEDDYSRKVVGAKIVEDESSWQHLSLAREAIERYGMPLAYYVDNHSIFRYAGYTSRHYKYAKGPDEGEIQFKRALESLGIGLIYTGKGEAQAKGKVEKRFDYLQRRLPYLCERYKIKRVEDAQTILNDLVGYYNEKREHQETGEIPSKRWENGVREGKGKLKPVDGAIDLEMIFSIHETRTVKKDGMLTFKGKEYKVGRHAGQEVTVCLIPGVKIMMYKGKDKLCEYHL